MTLLLAVRWLVGLPKWFKLGTAALALSAAVYAAGLHVVHNIRANEAKRIYARADSLHGTAMDSLRRTLTDSLRAHVRQANAIDSTLRKAAGRVRDRVRALPPAAVAIPEVRELALASIELAADADTMRAIMQRMTGLTERVLVVDSLTTRTLRVTIVKHQDQIRVLERRPVWWKVTLGAIGTAALGFAAGAISARE